MEKEIWKWIPGYKGDYKVSNLGRLKSFKRGKIRVWEPNIRKSGYRQTSLYKNGADIKSYHVHQVVAIGFFKSYLQGHKKVVDHINEIRHDNRLKNLQIISQRENLIKSKNEKNNPLNTNHHGKIRTLNNYGMPLTY